MLKITDGLFLRCVRRVHRSFADRVPVYLILGNEQEIAFRVRIEERILEEHFGDAWRRHAEATWAVVPLVW